MRSVPPQLNFPTLFPDFSDFFLSSSQKKGKIWEKKLFDKNGPKPGLVPRPETLGFPSQVRLPSIIKTTIPIPVPTQFPAFQGIQGYTIRILRSRVLRRVLYDRMKDIYIYCVLRATESDS